MTVKRQRVHGDSSTSDVSSDETMTFHSSQCWRRTSSTSRRRSCSRGRPTPMIATPLSWRMTPSVMPTLVTPTMTVMMTTTPPTSSPTRNGSSYYVVVVFIIMQYFVRIMSMCRCVESFIHNYVELVSNFVKATSKR
jgi:hypothetical protein